MSADVITLAISALCSHNTGVAGCPSCEFRREAAVEDILARVERIKKMLET